MDKYIGRLPDNRYEILEVIGVGGMAVVYKAKCHRLNRLVAIKILKDDYLEDEDFRNRFHAEGQAVAMLSHPNIVSVYDVSTTSGGDYIVMELIEGITLKQYMAKKGVLNEKETIHFATQIAKALDHAHSRGIVHRDIKPHNIMVLKNGSVKVADFGIARMIASGNTLTKEALGSVHYISPEQAKGEHVDARSDIYSLGVVMYEMSTGKQPYEGKTPVNVALQHIAGGAVMPSILNPGIPAGMEQIIMKAMAQVPDNRYASAVEMLAALDEFRKNPTVLFDYNNHGIDLRQPPKLERPRSADKTEKPEETPVRKTPPKAPPKQPPKKPVELPDEKVQHKHSANTTKNTKIARIAVISCTVAIIIAIAVLCFLLFGGNPFGDKDDSVTVPSFLGKNFDTLPSYPGITVVKSAEVYDNFVEAGKIISQDVVAGTSVPKGTTIYVTVSKGKEIILSYMPDLVNKLKSKAVDAMEDLKNNLQLNIVYEEEVNDAFYPGRVTRTVPAKDAVLENGQTIIIYIAKAKEIVKEPVPGVVGLNVQEAIDKLSYNGFKFYEIQYVDSNEPKDTVLTQSEEKNTKVDVTETIYLTVSKGPQTEATGPDGGAPDNGNSGGTGDNAGTGE